MPKVVIHNPTISSPSEEPQRRDFQGEEPCDAARTIRNAVPDTEHPVPEPSA